VEGSVASPAVVVGGCVVDGGAEVGAGDGVGTAQFSIP